MSSDAGLGLSPFRSIRRIVFLAPMLGVGVLFVHLLSIVELGSDESRVRHFNVARIQAPLRWVAGVCLMLLGLLCVARLRRSVQLVVCVAVVLGLAGALVVGYSRLGEFGDAQRYAAGLASRLGLRPEVVEKRRGDVSAFVFWDARPPQVVLRGELSVSAACSDSSGPKVSCRELHAGVPFNRSSPGEGDVTVESDGQKWRIEVPESVGR